MKIHDSVWSEFEEHADAIRGTAEMQIEAVKRVLETCQSPMEQLFLINVISLFDVQPVFMDKDLVHIFAHDEFDGFIAIYPQCPIAVGGHNYRVDFLFVYKTRHPFQEHVRIVVEIDGHDYHERTKEQARRDKERDRLMTMEGYTVMRYTGSEIHRDAPTIVFELQDYLGRIQQRIFQERGLTH